MNVSKRSLVRKMEQPEDNPYHVTIEVVNERCKGLKIIEELNITQYKLADIRGLPEGPTRHLVKVPKEQFEKIPKKTFKKVLGGEEAWLESDGCDVCNAILSNNSFLVSAVHTKDYDFIYDFVVPNYAAFQKIIKTLDDKEITSRIRRVAKFEPKGETLTERQERVLWLALKLGFFEYPRKINSIELSSKLRIAPSTLSEIKRRGMRKLLEKYFKT